MDGGSGQALDRRQFLAAAGTMAGAQLLSAAEPKPEPKPESKPAAKPAPKPLSAPTKNTVDDWLPAKAVTGGPQHHWFGYYDKTPWDKTGRYLLAMRADFIGRQPEYRDNIALGRVDLQDGNRWLPFATTHAWCWQQGTMLQWMPTAPDREVIYNVRENYAFGAVIQDVVSGAKRTLPRPIYAITSDGKQAVSLNFSRLGRCRPGYGYVGVLERGQDDVAPNDDGLFLMDLKTGDSKLIVSYRRLADHKPPPSFAGSTHWFNHVVWNPSGKRFLFLHRWGQPGKRWITRLYTSDPNGEKVRLVNDYGMTSHFDWRDDDTILAWAGGPHGDRYYLIADSDEAPDKRHKMIGDGVLTRDGHMSYTPDRKWFVTDTYVDENFDRLLILCDAEAGRRINIGKFHHPQRLLGPWRCDPHARWNRDGTQVCFDSAHEATRQMYVVDVSKYTRPK